MKTRRWSRLWRAREGLGAIELGFIAPVLLALLLGILDFGRAYWEQMEVGSAADAGAQWGMANGYDPSSIASVVQAATDLSIPSGNIASAYPCGCPSNTGVTLYACDQTCPDGSMPQRYIIVGAHICYSTIFTWPGLSYCSQGNTACGGCGSRQISLIAQSVVLK